MLQNEENYLSRKRKDSSLSVQIELVNCSSMQTFTTTSTSLTIKQYQFFSLSWEMKCWFRKSHIFLTLCRPQVVGFSLRQPTISIVDPCKQKQITFSQPPPLNHFYSILLRRRKLHTTIKDQMVIKWLKRVKKLQKPPQNNVRPSTA